MLRWKGRGETSPLKRLGPRADPHSLSRRGGRNHAGCSSLRRSSPVAATWAGALVPRPRRVWLGLWDNALPNRRSAQPERWRGASGPRPEASGGGALRFRPGRGGEGKGWAGLTDGSSAVSPSALRRRAAAGGSRTSVQKVLNTLSNDLKKEKKNSCFFGVVGGVFALQQGESKDLLQANFFDRKMTRVYSVLHILTL